jgi:hypothetical protein
MDHAERLLNVAKDIVKSAIVPSWNEQFVLTPVALFRELEAVEQIKKESVVCQACAGFLREVRLCTDPACPYSNQQQNEPHKIA